MQLGDIFFQSNTEKKLYLESKDTQTDANANETTKSVKRKTKKIYNLFLFYCSMKFENCDHIIPERVYNEWLYCMYFS